MEKRRGCIDADEVGSTDVHYIVEFCERMCGKGMSRVTESKDIEHDTRVTMLQEARPQEPGTLPQPEVPKEATSVEQLPASGAAAGGDLVETQAPSGNYFLRHWRGELSLGDSFWRGVFLTNLWVGALIQIAASVSDETPSASSVLLTVVLIWSTRIIVFSWQVHGLWLSAIRHRNQTGRGFWAGTAQMLCVIGVTCYLGAFLLSGFPLIAESTRLVAGHDRFGNYSLRLLNNGSEVEISGWITYGLTEDARTMISENPSIRVVELNSAGGRLGEAYRLRDFIKASGLDTYSATHCESACTIAFMGGKNRRVGLDGKLGFHRPAVLIPGLWFEALNAQVAKQKAQFVAAGVSEAFAARALDIPASSIWYPTRAELEEAHVITASP